ncbi:MAG: restriction endonuclease subunit S [Clostridium sp.]|uniref:restriction endonuclease subunit S n=1 Tax=Clostridium TaxID=1485 RepID=UPI00189BB6ED|nr:MULTISPECIES: restriction endonuclease subunit S [Clostridium]MDC0803559.1 restriction endonuclease subunit S [Clostridium paraputrificum]MDU1587478.1 restriction endonuclease subunit S [Clostridium sp.]
MSKIDTSSWGKFKVDDIFKIINGRGITKEELFLHPGTIVAIQSGEEQNGCIGYIDEEYCKAVNYYIEYTPCLTVARSGSSGHITYQENPFVVGDSAKILKNRYEMNKYHFLFIRTVLMQLKKKYSYNNKVSEAKYKEEIIYLPITTKGEPDWRYMEEYMRKLEVAVISSIEKLDIISNTSLNKIDLSNFKRFHLYDEGLFIIDSGTKLDKVRMSDNNPSINFVGRSNANNGVTDYIDEIEGLKPYDAGLLTISLGGEYLGSCFVQDKPFYTSQNVNVLIPKTNMSYYCKKYIATMVFKEGRLRYKAFIDELNRHMKTDFSIPLPVDKDGKIDWDYMDQYMRNIEARCSSKLTALI